MKLPVRDTTDATTDPVIYVDLPAELHKLGTEDGPWVNVARFARKADALEWIRVNIGECDDEGRVSLMVNDQPVQCPKCGTPGYGPPQSHEDPDNVRTWMGCSKCRQQMVDILKLLELVM